MGTTLTTLMLPMEFLALTKDIEDGDFLTREIGDLEVIVGKAEGRFFAVQDMCPHAWVPISNGSLEGRDLICPWHGMAFDVHSGDCTNASTHQGIRTLPIHIADGEIFLKIAG